MTRDQMIELALEAGWTLDEICIDEYCFQQLIKLVEKRKCKELSKKIALMPFGDTSASFAVWVKEQA